MKVKSRFVLKAVWPESGTADQTASCHEGVLNVEMVPAYSRPVKRRVLASGQCRLDEVGQ